MVWLPVALAQGKAQTGPDAARWKYPAVTAAAAATTRLCPTLRPLPLPMPLLPVVLQPAALALGTGPAAALWTCPAAAAAADTTFRRRRPPRLLPLADAAAAGGTTDGGVGMGLTAAVEMTNRRAFREARARGAY